MNVSALLEQLSSVYGHDFIRAVASEIPKEVLDEALMHPIDPKQAEREKNYPTALKKVLKAFERGFARHDKRQAAARMRDVRAHIDKEVKRHEPDDPDEWRKILDSLRSKKKEMQSKEKGKDGDKGQQRKAKKDRGKHAFRAPEVGGGREKAAGGGGGGAGGQERGKQKGAAGSGARGQHHPFKRSPNLGKGPGTPPGFPKVYGKKKHNQQKCWDCECGPIYTKGCSCTGTGARPSCPKGAKKKVVIRKDYRDAYNKMYHAWRAQKGGAVTARLKGGGRPGAF